MEEEIDEELNAIERKYSGNIEITDVPRRVKENLIKLNNEFETVGIPKIQSKCNSVSKIFDHVTQNFFTLINMYRKALKRSDTTKQTPSAQTQVTWSLLEKYENEVEEKKEKIICLEEKLKRLNYEKDNLQKEVRELKCELRAKKKAQTDVFSIYNHKIKNLQQQNESLKEKCGETIGKYTGTDDAIVAFLNKYKANEEIYKETIQKLQETNHQLLEEVVHLKYKDLNS